MLVLLSNGIPEREVMSSEERSLETVRMTAGFGDCTKLGGAVNLGMVDAEGAGVGNGGNAGLFGAVGMLSSVVGGFGVRKAGPLSWWGDNLETSCSSSDPDNVRILLGDAVRTDVRCGPMVSSGPLSGCDSSDTGR